MNVFTNFWRASQKASRCLCLMAKSGHDRLSMDNITYYAPFADKPVYLKETGSTDKRQASEFHEIRNQISSCLPDRITENTLLVVETTALECSDTFTGYIQSCITFYRLKRSISSDDHYIVLGTRQGSSKSPDLKRCLFLCSKKNATAKKSISLAHISKTEDLRVYRFVQRDQTNVLEQTMMEPDAADVKTNAHFRLDCPSVDSTIEDRIPPMFNNTTCSPVFHSFERTMDVLNRVSDMLEVQELLAIGKKELPESFNVESLQSQLKHPFVVVEGMDAAGKTTLTETLERKIQAVRYYTPPPCIQHLRKFFDTMPEIVRRAYYSLGNYIVAIQIAKECQQKAVVMDRLCEAYKRMSNPACTEVDASGSRETVVDIALSVLKQHGVVLS
ncbi:uncharacterized protein LOC124278207 isoform X2 [Haliotis rubra]|uniref:uncharacterized protein LOC124278207 isoform X2 n=1 Tax=Haliotis rubra TaxID=36100 RepID=UPI001EE627A7|nr:uncharacterized protein LOC124278207 isoform X2 [Haliotis rubra]